MEAIGPYALILAPLEDTLLKRGEAIGVADLEGMHRNGMRLLRVKSGV